MEEKSMSGLFDGINAQFDTTGSLGRIERRHKNLSKMQKKFEEDFNASMREIEESQKRIQENQEEIDLLLKDLEETLASL